MGRYYYGFVPFLRDLDPSIAGAVILAGILLVGFLFFGWLYDDVLRLWNEKSQVAIEKDPYSYVPLLRVKMLDYPYFYSWLYLLKNLAEEVEVSTQWLSDLAAYLHEYYSRRPDKRTDLFGSLPKGEAFLLRHPFAGEGSDKSPRRNLASRAKKMFMLQVWRLSWVQNFTGVVQDSLVFAALYVGILFGLNTGEGTVPVGLMLVGIILIAVPFVAIQIAAGWYYDKKLQLWSPDQVVKVERNPFTYIPEPRLVGFAAPFLFVTLSTLRELCVAYGIPESDIERLANHIDAFFGLAAGGERGIERALQLQREFGEVFTIPTTVDPSEEE